MNRYHIGASLLVATFAVAMADTVEVYETVLPLVIEVTQDVPVRRLGLKGQQRGVLYAAAEFTISKGQRFQMITIGQEGSCEITFQGVRHSLSSCPWLPRFRDHQQDIFVTISGAARDEQ